MENTQNITTSTQSSDREDLVRLNDLLLEMSDTISDTYHPSRGNDETQLAQKRLATYAETACTLLMSIQEPLNRDVCTVLMSNTAEIESLIKEWTLDGVIPTRDVLRLSEVILSLISFISVNFDASGKKRTGLRNAIAARFI